MVALEIAHTSELDDVKQRVVRAFLDAAFGGEFSDSDWEHGLGGIHVLLWADADLVGHGSVVQRRILHAGRSLRAGYVEAVGVRGDSRGQGYGRLIMRELEAVITNAYDIGALSATDDGAALYRALGWTLWTGPSSVLSPDGIVRTSGDDGSIYVLPLASGADPAGEITCDWRPGDVW